MEMRKDHGYKLDVEVSRQAEWYENVLGNWVLALYREFHDQLDWIHFNLYTSNDPNRMLLSLRVGSAKPELERFKDKAIKTATELGYHVEDWQPWDGFPGGEVVAAPADEIKNKEYVTTMMDAFCRLHLENLRREESGNWYVTEPFHAFKAQVIHYLANAGRFKEQLLLFQF